MTVKVAVISYSSTGTVHARAQAVAEGATSARGRRPPAPGRRLARFALRLKGAPLPAGVSQAA